MERTGKKRYWLWLNLMTEGSARRFYSLLDDFDGAPEALFRAASAGKLTPGLHMNAALVEKLQSGAKESVIDAFIEKLEKLKIMPVTLEDQGYPRLLKEIYDPPSVLYVKGRLQDAALPLALIGSRKYSEYGKTVALGLGEELAQSGACVVSGLAYGIDGFAAKGALSCTENEYPTIAVLGCGADVVYPSQNRGLYEQIAERGAVVSEFLPGAEPLPAHFPMRNRIISGLARGLVVVEARLKSGTNITVDCALEQGRDVFAVPGRITDLNSEGANRLIRDGMAKPVCCARDILEEYGVAPAGKTKKPEVDDAALSFEESLILKLLEAGERSTEELCELTGLGAPKINSALTVLEISGIIKQSRGKVYRI